MDTELYQLMHKNLESIQETLKGIDERLRHVEKEVASIIGHQSAITRFKDYFLVGYGVFSTIFAVVVLIWK